MNDLVNNGLRRVPALIVAIIWGTTFMVSKSILAAGVTPFQLISFRFVLAYVALCVMCPKAREWKADLTELKLFGVAITGGSLYFVLEYSGLQLSSATNVGLICSTVPIIAAFFYIVMGRMRLTGRFVGGSILALVGVALVVMNGVFVLKLNPLGDFIAFLAAVSWAVYSALLSLIPEEVSELQTTRRLFFYGAITILPVLAFDDGAMSVGEIWERLEWTQICGACYLGLIASGASLWLWNVSFRIIGANETNQFLYLMPIVSATAGALFMSNEFTMWIGLGAVLIFGGLILVDRKE